MYASNFNMFYANGKKSHEKWCSLVALAACIGLIHNCLGNGSATYLKEEKSSSNSQEQCCCKSQAAQHSKREKRREEKEKTIRRRLKKMNETHGVWDIRQIWTHLCKCHAQKINKLVVCRIDYVCCIVFGTHIFCWLQNKSHLGKLAAKLRAPFHWNQ